MKEPTGLPTVLIGYVHGPVRMEQVGGQDSYPDSNRAMLFNKPKGKFAVTHIQKKSRFGFLLMWPLCFHIWFQFRFQRQRMNENGDWIWKPGSEFVIYRRLGLWRWEAGSGRYIGPWTIYFNFSTHWD